MSEPVRVLLVITTSDFGGTESFLERLVTGLDQNRFEPVVCSLCPPGRTGRRLAERGFQVFSLDMAPDARMVELARGALQLARRIDQLEIDVVQGLLYRGNVISALAARLSRRRPKVVAGQRSLTPMTGRSAALAARWTRGLTHRTVAVSTAVKQFLVKAEGAPAQRIEVIGNGVDIDVFRPGDRAAARRVMGLPMEGLVIGAVGRLVPEKGLPFFFTALAGLRSKGHSVIAALVGDGPDREALHQQAEQLAVEVRFLGVRREVPKLYPGFDIFCLPSLEEGSPQVLLEAMACGCPAVATAVGGVPEVITHPSQGLLVPAADPTALETALRSLIDDPAARARLGAEARRHVVAKFDLALGIRAHEDLYASLI